VDKRGAQIVQFGVKGKIERREEKNTGQREERTKTRRWRRETGEDKRRERGLGKRIGEGREGKEFNRPIVCISSKVTIKGLRRSIPIPFKIVI
jgi:hypothetical protein